jgi:hypothetical protein
MNKELSDKNKALLEAFNKGYRVSECGEYLTTPFSKLTKKNFTHGYPVFGYRIDGKKLNVTWHRLQAYQKYGDMLFEKGILVRHTNHIITDCSWDHILIGTAKDNMEDNPREDVLKYALNATDKWRKYNASEVKEFYSTCKSYKQTMKKFNISSKGTLHFILNKAVCS